MSVVPLAGAVCRRCLCVPALATALVFSSPPAAAQAPPVPAAAATDCNDIAVDVDRLVCYDRKAGRGPRAANPTRPAVDPAATGTAKAAAAASAEQAAAAARVSPTEERLAQSLSLSTVWELTPAEQRGTFKLLPHQTNYLLPVRWSSSINTRPSSPAPEHSQGERLPIQPFEAKFQFSVKIKAVENIFGPGSDLWLGYTQQSNWQIYNGGGSSPVRENDYEPEAILSFATDTEVLGWRWRLFNIGLLHQSNGRPLPLSRSWNRVYAQFGLERGNWTVQARPWVRIPESASGDDNPDIIKNYGWGDLRVAVQRNGNVWSALGRVNPRSGRGALQFDWAFPLSGALRGYLQITNGHGESLVDYNHSQTTIGFGLLLLPWQ